MAKIETWRQEERAESRCRLDEGFVFSCEFSYPRRQVRPRNLSETISAAYGLERRSLRVLTAETEFYFTRFQGEPHWLLEDVTWRSNPRLDSGGARAAAGDGRASRRQRTRGAKAELKSTKKQTGLTVCFFGA